MTNKPTTKWYGFVPNLFTSLNLVCGVIGTYLALNDKIQTAIILMFVAAVFDFFDGFLARLLKVSGDMGKELDSLADLISFGLVPGAMIFVLQKNLIPEFATPEAMSLIQWFYILIPIMIPVFSALRLAKFNIDERQHTEFIGIPTPANALFLASLAWTLTYRPDGFLGTINNPITLSVITIAFSLLLVSEIRLFALKFKSFSWGANKLRYIFLICSAVFIAIFQIAGFMAVILLYIILSIGRNLTEKK
jgi:CDP-diacylglycerol---serine O-phosphatidyltransferase